MRAVKQFGYNLGGETIKKEVIKSKDHLQIILWLKKVAKIKEPIQINKGIRISNPSLFSEFSTQRLTKTTSQRIYNCCIENLIEIKNKLKIT